MFALPISGRNKGRKLRRRKFWYECGRFNVNIYVSTFFVITWDVFKVFSL